MPREEQNRNRVSRKRRLDNSSTATSCDGANNNNNNNNRELDSQGADLTNRSVQNSKTACVILVCFFQQKGFSSSLVEQLACDPNLLPYFRKAYCQEYGKIWSGALFSTVLWVLATVLRNKTKRAKN